MIATYQSSNFNKDGATSSLAVTAPTGIALGDLLMGFLYKNHTNAVTVPSGFTLLKSVTDGGGTATYYTYYKIADSGDVAAGTFTFSWTSNIVAIASVIRINGQATSGYIGTENASWETSTFDVSATTTIGLNSLTPDFENSLFVFALGTSAAGTRTFSGYSMANNDPSWSEPIDTGQGVLSLAIAIGVRPSNSATGTINASINSAGDKLIAFGIFIKSLKPNSNLTLLGVS